MSENEQQTEERRVPWLALALGVVVVAYSAAPFGDFVWDDRALILEQSRVHRLQPLYSYFDSLFFGGEEGTAPRGFYRPLVVLSFAVDWQVWGGSPFGFHLTNLFLHLLCVSLVYALARRFGAPAAAAGIAAALFGALPRLTEAVAWISGRTDLLAALFVLAALWVHGERQGRRWLAALLLGFGLLSKEVAVAGFAALAFWEGRAWFRTKDGLRGLLLRGAPLAASMGAYAILRIRAFQEAKALLPPPDLPLERRLVLILEAAGTYAAMILDPLRPRTQIGSIFHPTPGWAFLGGLLLLSVAVGCAWLVWKRRLSGEIWGLVLLGAVPLLLVLHAIPLPQNVVAADRFLYLPAAAGALLLARGWERLPSAVHQRRGLALGLVGALVFAGCTHLRSLDWADELTLWSEAVTNAPKGNSLPHLEYARALSRAGRADEAFPYIEEAEAIEAELRRKGWGGKSHGNLVARIMAHLALGEFDEAAKACSRLVELYPKEPGHAFNLAVIHAMKLDFPVADRLLDDLLERHPGYERARAYQATMRQVAAAFDELPPEREGEPAAVALRRAELYEALGRTGDAKRIRTGLATAGE